MQVFFSPRSKIKDNGVVIREITRPMPVLQLLQQDNKKYGFTVWGGGKSEAKARVP
jgi:hypothetical protein